MVELTACTEQRQPQHLLSIRFRCLALYRLEEIQTATEVGHSRLQIFRLLVNDWRDRETVWSP